MHRRGKLFVLELDGDLSLVIHLMSAGRLQLFDTRASLRDRTSRLLVRLTDGRELRLREFGTHQRAWVKLMRTPQLDDDETLPRWARGVARSARNLLELLDQPRPLYAVLRDQDVIAGIGRSWVDEILHTAMLSPFKRGSDLDPDEAERLRAAIVERLGDAVAHYEQVVSLPIPDKLPMPLTVHRHQGGALPALRRSARGRVLRGLRDVLLPDLSDGGQGPQGPPPITAVEVGDDPHAGLAVIAVPVLDQLRSG